MLYLFQIPGIEPETIKALEEAGVAIAAIVAIVIITVILSRVVNNGQQTTKQAMDALDRNTVALSKLSDRHEKAQERDAQQKEFTAKYIAATDSAVRGWTDSVMEMQDKLNKSIEGQTDALRGREGVIERLQQTTKTIESLTEQTGGVVETAKTILHTLEQVNEALKKMNASDDEVKEGIASAINKLETLITTSQQIPNVIGATERNIIAAIEHNAAAKTRPIEPPIVTDAPNGAVKEKKDETPVD